VGAVSRAAEWLKPSSWINSKVVLHFVCPVTRTAVGGGFELQLPKDWVVRYGPAIRVGLTMLQVGAAGARLAGLPVPRLSELTGLAMESMDAQLGYLKELVDGVSAELQQQGLGFVNEWAAEKLEGARAEYTDLAVAAEVEGVPKQLSEAVQKSYQEVRSLLDSLPPKAQGWEAKVRDGKSCGLLKAVCEADGSFEWVEPKWKAAYEARGRALLGLSEEELSA